MILKTQDDVNCFRSYSKRCNEFYVNFLYQELAAEQQLYKICYNNGHEELKFHATRIAEIKNSLNNLF